MPAIMCFFVTAGCSGSGPASSPTTRSAPSTMSAELVNRLVTGIVRQVRPVLQQERRSCGGSQAIDQGDAASAPACEAALARLSVLAKNLASRLAFVRPPIELRQLVGDTGDAAGAVVTLSRNYPVRDCLPTRAGDAARRARCDSAGREFAGVIAELEQSLSGWPN